MTTAQADARARILAKARTLKRDRRATFARCDRSRAHVYAHVVAMLVDEDLALLREAWRIVSEMDMRVTRTSLTAVPDMQLRLAPAHTPEHTIDEQLHQMDLVRENHIVQTVNGLREQYRGVLRYWKAGPYALGFQDPLTQKKVSVWEDDDDLQIGRAPSSFPEEQEYEALIAADPVHMDVLRQLGRASEVISGGGRDVTRIPDYVVTETRQRDSDDEEFGHRDVTYEPCVMTAIRTHQQPPGLTFKPSLLGGLTVRRKTKPLRYSTELLQLRQIDEVAEQMLDATLDVAYQGWVADGQSARADHLWARWETEGVIDYAHMHPDAVVLPDGGTKDEQLSRLWADESLRIYTVPVFLDSPPEPEAWRLSMKGVDLTPRPRAKVPAHLTAKHTCLERAYPADPRELRERVLDPPVPVAPTILGPNKPEQRSPWYGRLAPVKPEPWSGFMVRYARSEGFDSVEAWAERRSA